MTSPASSAPRGEGNTLAVQVTPGWWADKIITPKGHHGMIGRKCAFRGVLELAFADGTKRRYGTNTEEWKAGIAGPVRHAAIFDGEEYDAREPMGYDCADRLSAPEVNTEFGGEILPSDGAEIYLRSDLALAPARAYVWKDVEGAKRDEAGRVVVAREFAPGDVMSGRPRGDAGGGLRAELRQRALLRVQGCRGDGADLPPCRTAQRRQRRQSPRHGRPRGELPPREPALPLRHPTGLHLCRR